MSNIGKKVIIIPDKTEIKIDSNMISVKGVLGELKLEFNSYVSITENDNVLSVQRKDDSRKSREMHGLYRALVQNMILGVSEGYKKELTFVGVGYTVEKKNDFLLINAGYSHPIYFQIPNGIEVDLPNNTSLIIKGINKQNVGDVAARIRGIRKPEPYKGKGIKYSDEYIRKKAGKTVGVGAQ
tara:strand:- start:103 stop:651 length:549 start_codon:yes stop_codon:yes gene_type:complete